MEKRLEEIWVELFVKDLPSNIRTVDVGYYSGGGLNHFKTSRLFPFSDHFLPFHCRTTI